MNGAKKRLFELSERKGMVLRLGNVRKIKAALGHPDYAYTTVHVGGTNGKGSVATKIAKGLELTGKKVGLYTSPHLIDYEERFQVNGSALSSEQVERGLKHLFSLCDAHDILATYFELSTMLALHLFAEELVDYAVIEVGMGGRLDATNVILPTLSVITSIGLDHTEHLGATLEEIAKEKAGIIKRQVPVVLGPSAQNLGIEEVAEKQEAPCHQVVGTFEDFREENDVTAKLALTLLGVASSEIEVALQTTPPGRFDQIPLLGGILLVDAAHNEPALISLFQLIEARYPDLKKRVIASFTKGHHVAKMRTLLSERADHLTFVQLTQERAAPLEDGRPFDEVWEEALRTFDPSEELLILCGSCYLVGELFESRAKLELGAGWQSGGGPHTNSRKRALAPT